jgi:hypothetical protein
MSLQNDHSEEITRGRETFHVSATEVDASIARTLAIQRIRRRRSFHIELTVSGIAVALLVLIWATSEYHNSGGWPTQGFSQSSGVHDVWNFWIIYPIIGWILVMAGRAWSVYGRNETISEREVNRELERQSARR